MIKGKWQKHLILLCLFAFALPLFGHEFWLQPDKFIYQRGDNINIRFLVGENFEGENWSGNNEKSKSLKLYFAGGIDDMNSQLSEEKGDSIQFSLYDECTAMITFNSTNSFITLPSQKFNEYLTEDGLQDALDYRQKHNLGDSAGKELYQRSVKTIFQVGSPKSNVSLPTDLPLDIIPQSNPYNLKNNDSLGFTILFNKKPLAGQVLMVWQRSANKTTSCRVVTDTRGLARIKVNTKGKWMISTVKMLPLLNDEKADWQSFWGSCTWGYE